MSASASGTQQAVFSFGLRELSAAIIAISALSLGGALLIEHVGGIPPCPLCLDQRIAYYLAVPLGAMAFFLSSGAPVVSRIILGLLAIGFAVNAGLGVYHSGIEWGWWLGPDACSGGAGPIARTPADLLNSLAQPRVVRCDEAALRILGLSLAGYSALISAFLMLIAGIGALKGSLLGLGRTV